MRRGLLAAGLAAAAACGSGPTAPGSFADPVFTVSPVVVSEITLISPLGVMSGGFHVLPSRHAGLFLAHGIVPVDVFAPGAGSVEFINHSSDDLVRVKVAADFSYELGHIRLDPAFQLGTRVSAGQRLGTTSDVSGSIDFGVINAEVTRTFAAPARYDETGLHADHFLNHYAEPLRTQLAALVPTAGDKAGTDCFDRDGTLEGNWFATGTPLSTEAQNQAYWPGYLAFVYDAYVKSQVIVSFGASLGVTISGGTDGPFGALDGPPPESVTPASGPVVYLVTAFLSPPGTFGTAGTGTILVQMTDGRHVRVEGFPDARPNPVFDGNARTYER